jgi:hypothetical protein
LEALVRVVDINWSGGFVVGIIHTDEAIVETEETEKDSSYEFCQAVILHLGFFNVAILFF